MNAVGDLVDIADREGFSYEAQVVAVRSEDDFVSVPTDPGLQICPGPVRVTVTPHLSL